MSETVTIEELREWMKACDPSTPVARSDPHFVNLFHFEIDGQTHWLRGSGVEGLSTLSEAIQLAEGRSCHLFSGFSGTGKSSELLGLQSDLEAQGYLVLIADAANYLNLQRPLTIADLLVVVAAAFGDVASTRLGKTLGRATYLTRLVEFMKQDVEMGGITLPTGITDLEIGIKVNQPFWIQVRDRLSASIGKLRDHVHGFVREVMASLQSEQPTARGIVFVFDSLEKIRGTMPDEFDAVIASVDEVFGKNAELVRLPCHVVYALPPYVRHLEFGALYDHVTDVLPSIKVHERQSTRPHGPGVEALCQVVRLRIPVARVFGRDDELLRRLVGFSGGHVRLLLTLVRDAMLHSKRTFPLTPTIIDRVVQRRREDAEGSLWRERLPVLRDVMHHGELPGMSREDLPTLAGLLDEYIVLCYRNGDGWYDVHPLIRDKLEQLLERETRERDAARARPVPDEP